MKNYEAVENKVITMVCNKFLDEFEEIYKGIKGFNKGFLIEQISGLFRKWYYSTLIGGTSITPGFIAEYCSEGEFVYPVMKSNYFRKIGGLKVNNYKYSVYNHPICNDFIQVVSLFKKGIILDDDFKMEFEDIKKMKDITSFDRDYISYLVMLGIDLDYIEKMPSLGVEVYCAGKRAENIYDIDKRELLIELIDAAIKLAVSFLNDDIYSGDNYIDDEQVKNWLVNPIAVDEIFESAFGQIRGGLDVVRGGEMGEMEGLIISTVFSRGINLDRWFLTPFSYYFRIIDTVYMYEFDFFEEIIFLLNAAKNYEVTGDDLIMDSALYSPCTGYKLSRLGAEFFGVKCNFEMPYIFKNISPNEIIMGAMGNDSDLKNKIRYFYEPEYSVLELKIADKEGSKLCFNIKVRADMKLSALQEFINSIYEKELGFCIEYRFYKLPENPFTQFASKALKERGPFAEDYSIGDVIKKDEKLFYEFKMTNFEEATDSYIEESADLYTLSITLIDSSVNELGKTYPSVENVSPE